MAFTEASTPDLGLMLRLGYRFVADGRARSLAVNKVAGATTVHISDKRTRLSLPATGSAQPLVDMLRRGETPNSGDRFESVAAMLLVIVARGVDADRTDFFELKRCESWFGLKVRFAAFLGTSEHVAHVCVDKRFGYEAVAFLVNDMKEVIAPLPKPEDFAL